MSGNRRMTSRRDLARALRTVAALEHQVMCEYLFAALSLKKWTWEGGVTEVQLEQVREWQSVILLVARQEMEHLGIVSNLLSAIGEKPYFGFGAGRSSLRPNLRPLSRETLEHFIAIEEAHDPPVARNRSDADAGDAGESIGEIYGRICDGFEELSETVENLFVGLPGVQVGNGTIDLRPGLYHIQLHTASDIGTARAALDHVLGSSHGTEDSHAERFRRVLSEFELATSSDPTFDPVRPVAPNPTIRGPSAEAMGETVTHVTDPLTRTVFELFNSAYEAMLMILGRFYSPSYETVEERMTLKRLAFFPLMTMIVRPLGELLTLMPVGADSGRVAGPGFEFEEPLDLHPEKRTAWLVLHGQLKQLAERARVAEQGILERSDLNQRALASRFALLRENLETLAIRFETGTNLKYEYLQQLLQKAL